MYKRKSKIMDDGAINRALTRIAHEIIEHNAACSSLLIVGIKRRGRPLAQIIAENINRFSSIKTELAEITISRYRDDLDEDAERANFDTEQIFEVKNKTIILVDDVLHTGRSVRAAIDALISMGRPASIQLAVLVDRGHRELPIRGDYVGKNIPTSKKELVAVRLPGFDKTDEKEVVILEKVSSSSKTNLAADKT